LGGPGIIVEIDESMFNHKVKSHRGRGPARRRWVFGMVDGSYTPARGVMKVVEERNS
jgi:hypothetical protein